LIFRKLGRHFSWKPGAWQIEFVVVGEWYWCMESNLSVKSN